MAFVGDSLVLSSASVVDVGDGLYEVAYRLQRGLDYTVHITLDGQHIPGSPFTVDVIAAETDPSQSIINGTIASISTVARGVDSTVVLQTVDQFSNPRSQSDDSINITAYYSQINTDSPSESTLIPLTINVIDHLDGRYEFQYQAPDLEQFFLHIRINNESISNSPFTSKWQSTDPSDSIRQSVDDSA